MRSTTSGPGASCQRWSPEQLLDAERAPARLMAFADRQANALTLPELLETIIKATWDRAGCRDAALAVDSTGDASAKRWTR